MAKKRFSQGLDDLFSSQSQAAEAHFEAQEPAFAHIERKAAHKSFATDLDALLQEALDESLERFEANQPDAVTASAKSKGEDAASFRQSIHSGIDALIRQTIDVQSFTNDEQSGKKRLTVAVDRPKLEQLKTIARLENAYLKDLLVAVIDEYIDKYVQARGVKL